MTDNNNVTGVEKKKRNKGVFVFNEFRVSHELCAQKVGTDALLVAGYTAIGKNKEYSDLVWTSGKEYDYAIGLRGEKLNTDRTDGWPNAILDVGTGCGVLSLMLAQRFPESVVHSIDIDETAIAQTTININAIYQESPNQMTKNMYLFHSPVQEFDPVTSVALQLNNGTKSPHPQPSGGKYELIIAAPPYFKSDVEIDGNVSSMPDNRRIARHTHTLTMRDLVGSVIRLIKPDSGRFTTIVSIPYPSDDLEVEAKRQGLILLELINVTDTPSSAVVRKMYTFYLPSAQTTVEPIIRNFSIYETSIKDSNLRNHRKHSNTYKWMLNDFCNHFHKEKDNLI